ncbi:MAG TPA: deoxyribonuclease IV, partial [Bacilli bacterium]|nr:deoxyribonuclease IV [Bacilli bacterium]
MLLIGCHVSFDNEQLLGATKEAISYGANTFMFYTGAPINTTRSPINDNLTLAAYQLMKDKIVLEKVICHAPYIVNLANRQDPDKFNFSVNFLKQEVTRCEQMNIKYLVIHPGNTLGIPKETGLKNVIDGLNLILYPGSKVTILVETMAGKGSELGSNLSELKTIINNVKIKANIGVCLDTCHLHDAGYDLNAFDVYLNEFAKEILNE